MADTPKLARPDDTWEGFANWRGPRGTAIDSWANQVRQIHAAIAEREEKRRERNKNYRTRPAINWRLDCLADLLVVLEGQPRV